MTLSLVHIYDFVAFTQANFVMTQLIDYSPLHICFTYWLYHYLLFIRSSKRLCLPLKEFTGDLCWMFCCDVQLHLRNLAWPSNKIVQCYNILGHTMQVWDFNSFINNKQQQCFQITPATCGDIRPLGNQVFCATFPVVWVRIRSFPLFGNISWAGWNNIPLACFIMWVATV